MTPPHTNQPLTSGNPWPLPGTVVSGAVFGYPVHVTNQPRPSTPPSPQGITPGDLDRAAGKVAEPVGGLCLLVCVLLFLTGFVSAQLWSVARSLEKIADNRPAAVQKEGGK